MNENTSLTFDLKTARDRLEGLRGAISAFRKDPLNTSNALDIANVAWSICDWVFEEHGARLGFQKLPSFQEHIRDLCPELSYLQDLATASKHRDVKYYTPYFIKTWKQGGDFSRDFSRDFNISRLMVKTRDGNELWYEDVIDDALNFWEGFFEKKRIG